MTYKATDFVNLKQLLLGVSVLFIGAFVYIVDRSHTQFLFVPTEIYLPAPQRLFGEISYYLPSLIHVFAFSLISISFMKASHGRYVLCCGFWATVNLIFEVGQSKSAFHYLESNFFIRLDNNIVTDNVFLYFQNGTFDWLDVIAIISGGCIAYLVSSAFIIKQGD